MQHLSPTERKLLERLVVTAFEPALMLWDPDGIVVGWYPGAAKTFGYSPDDIVGRQADVLYTPEDRALGIPEYEVAVALKRGVSENDRWMLRSDGATIWVNGVLSPIRGDSGELLGFGKMLRNRTDSRGQIEKLENQTERLELQSKTNNLAISTLAHELRGPLSAISNAAEVLGQLSPPSEFGSAAVEIIGRQCRSMSRLVEDLLDVTALQIGKRQLRFEHVSIDEVISAAIETSIAAAHAKQQTLDKIVASGQIFIDGDFGRLQQVFVNLIQNAVKFTPPEGHIWVKASAEGAEAVVRVEDNGIGIAPDVLPRIFDLFAQAADAGDQPQPGLGIGLSLVKEIVTLHNGTVQVRSDGLGKGCEFSVRLPRSETA